MIITPLDLMLLLLAAGLLIRARRDLKREQARSDVLATALATRIEAEADKLSEAYCVGWSERASLESWQVKGRVGLAAAQRAKGAAN